MTANLLAFYKRGVRTEHGPEAASGYVQNRQVGALYLLTESLT
jgi:hypothetical protein